MFIESLLWIGGLVLLVYMASQADTTITKKRQLDSLIARHRARADHRAVYDAS